MRGSKREHYEAVPGAGPPAFPKSKGLQFYALLLLLSEVNKRRFD